MSEGWNASDPVIAWEEMQRILFYEADKQCPVKTYKIRNSKPYWLTNEIIEQMKDRDYFYQKAKKNESEDDWNIAKFHRNQVNFNVRRAKADYIKEQLECNEGNSAKFWRVIKQVMPNKKGTKSTSRITVCNEKDEVIDRGKVVSIMNDYFVGLGKVTNRTVKDNESHQNNPNPKDINIIQTPTHTAVNSEVGIDLESDQFDFKPISRVEVEGLIRKINVSKSSGITLLSSKLLKDGFQALSDKLTYLFSFSIQQKQFPSQWKTTLVIPIPKTENPKKIENYRPISLLPLPGIFLEKLIHSQLSSYLENNDLLAENQFGFRKQRSTSHAISQLLNQVYTNINKSAITAAVYIDFSKAFNSVQHSTLMTKLSKLNLSAHVISWISSYLQDRKQKTLANNIYSSYLPVSQGVPQGSVLGPLLYIIYANDITDIIENSGFTFYADDTVLYSTKKSLKQAQSDLQDDLNRLTEWCKENEIFINTEKTRTMFFGGKARMSKISLPDFYINGNVLQRAQTYTYLGIKLDEQLTLETYANVVVERVSQKVYQLKKIRSLLTNRAALLIYKNMILPILEYGDIFLHSASQKIKKKLQVLQNRALGKKKLYSTDNLHDEAKLLKLKDRRPMHVLLHMFQLARLPGFRLWKRFQSAGMKTRSSKKKLISCRKPNNEKYRKSITYQGPKLWNSLPTHIQKAESYQEFKIGVKKWFQDKASIRKMNLSEQKVKRKASFGGENKNKNKRKGKETNP